MINPKYLSPEIKDKLNRFSLELCEYRYTSKFKKDIVLKWIEIVGQRGVNIEQYLNMIDILTDLSQYWRSCLRKILILFCYERDFMKDLSSDIQADVIKAFNSTSRYLDYLLNIDNPYFEGMVNQIYPSELQLNKANTSDTEAPFLDLHLSISNGYVSSKIHDKRDDFDFDIVNFPFLDGDVPRRPSYGVYISQLIRFARVCSHVDDFNTRNKCLTAKLLKQGYRYHKLRKAFSKFYR